MELGILHNSPPSTKRGCRAGRLHRLWHGLPPAPWPCTRSQHHSVPSRNLHPLMVPPFLQPHPDLQSAVGNAPLSSKHPAQLPTTDCLLSIISPMGGQPSDAPALSPPSPLQQGGQSSNAPALSPPSPLPQSGQPIALALSPPSPPPQGGQPSDAPGLSPSSSTLLLCPSDSTLNICHLNSQSAVKTGNLHLSLLRSLFQGLPNLHELYLSDLALGNLDLGLFSGLDSLMALDLSNNEIKDVPTSVASPSFLRNLQSLDLSYNQLSFLSNNTAPLLRRVTRVVLAGNPWDCTCELQWMQRFTAHIFPAHQGSHAVTCQTPEAVSSRALALLRRDQLICVAPQIVNCDPVDPQPQGVSFHVKCTLTGTPFPFVSWKTADGTVTIGSSRGQMSPYLDVQGDKVTLTLLASSGINGTLTVMVQNIYGMGRENIPIIIQPTPTTITTTTTTTTTTTATPSPTTTASNTKEGGGDKEGGGGGGMMMFIAAGAGGGALLISAIITAVACKKINKAKVEPDEEKKKSERKDGGYDEDVEEMDYGRESVGGGRPPTALRAMSAWDV
ncbi:hypothetical protein ACOMHN_048048 [Nucella lapillus]